MESDRKQQYVRAAQFRAKAQTYVNATCLDWTSSAKVCEALEAQIAALGLTTVKAQVQLRNLANNKLIMGRKAGKDMEYRSLNGRARLGTPGPLLAEPAARPASAPDLKVDLLRDSGRVRLELAGLVIEVGVR